MRSMRLAMVVLLVGWVSALFPVQVLATFHLWKFDQVFSNADGSQQFVEMSTDSDGQQFFNTDQGGPFGPAMLISTGNTFSFPNDLADPAAIGHDTAGQHLLIASTGFSPKGLKPDFVVPTNFFATTADSLKFTSNDPLNVLDTISWDLLPTNGTDALHQVPGTVEKITGAATASSFTGLTDDGGGGGGGGGGSAIPLPAGVYTGLAGLGLAMVMVHRGVRANGYRV